MVKGIFDLVRNIKPYPRGARFKVLQQKEDRALIYWRSEVDAPD